MVPHSPVNEQVPFRLELVSMPWHSLDTPSLAMGILGKLVRQRLPKWEVRERYANVAWAEKILDMMGLLPADYDEIATNVFSGIGEWVFSSALHETIEWKVDQFMATLDDGTRRWESTLRDLHRATPAFVAALASSIVADNPTIIGLTTTFMQTAPSLALARAVKKLRPETIVVMGGANCDGKQGEAIHRAFPYVDFVVCGEGERPLVELLTAIEVGAIDLSSIASLCWRRDGSQVRNPDGPMFPIDQVPMPDHDAYFDTIGNSPILAYVNPQIVLEAARGCWWGEKHHCTFCGLNGSGMKFRSKQPDVVWNEIATLVERHKVLDITMVDNIMDMDYFGTLLPRIQRSGLDLRIHYEVKANLSPAQLDTLAKAKVFQIQPGIESLSSSVLQLMNKGVAGVQNVALLRNAESRALTVSWNILYGFPGESSDEYERVIAQIPNLYHLQPPTGASRICLERFSPHFNDASLGFPERWPAPFYEIVFDEPIDVLSDLAFLFNTPPLGINGDLENRLRAAVETWIQAFPRSSLFVIDEGEQLLFMDGRLGRGAKYHEVRSRLECATYRQLLGRPHSRSSLTRSLSELGITVRADALDHTLNGFRQSGLVFEDGDRVVAVATAFDPTTFKPGLRVMEAVA